MTVLWDSHKHRCFNSTINGIIPLFKKSLVWLGCAAAIWSRNMISILYLLSHKLQLNPSRFDSSWNMTDETWNELTLTLFPSSPKLSNTAQTSVYNDKLFSNRVMVHSRCLQRGPEQGLEPEWIGHMILCRTHPTIPEQGPRHEQKQGRMGYTPIFGSWRWFGRSVTVS